MTATLVSLTPDLASRIIEAFGPNTEIGSQTSSELIDTVAWYASNDLDREFLDANPNTYEFEYLKQFFANMIADEATATAGLLDERIEMNLAKVWVWIKFQEQSYS
ncbi:MAG: hypothetical protein EOP04_07675 [Proteobacteria bacterium]|nr:MAG: hypothetical protein EOP04_07675 [Pseudomonadota bacterium]